MNIYNCGFWIKSVFLFPRGAKVFEQNLLMFAKGFGFGLDFLGVFWMSVFFLLLFHAMYIWLISSDHFSQNFAEVKSENKP